MTTFAKLRSGEWGVRGDAADIREGATVTVRKRSGETRTVRIGRVLWTGDGKAIATIDDTHSRSGHARPAESQLRQLQGRSCPNGGDCLSVGRPSDGRFLPCGANDCG